ncbi:TPA: hypothetical protein ACG5HK_001224, partial [Streptococcus agalactiae]
GVFCCQNFLVLELCCFEWFQNFKEISVSSCGVLELCCFEWFQNFKEISVSSCGVLELCCFEWFQNKHPQRDK